MRPELLFLIIVIGWFAIGKVLLYLHNLYIYNEEMEYRRNVPHATTPPKKPTFFNYKKQH